MEYREERFDLINNPNYVYYKLYVDDKCIFDDFLEEISVNIRYMKELKNIYGYMDFLGGQKLPKEKFNFIKGVKRSDVYEFKTKHLRVYVIVQKPCIYIVAGGYKTTQDENIARFKRRIKDFPEIDS